MIAYRRFPGDTTDMRERSEMAVVPRVTIESIDEVTTARITGWIERALVRYRVDLGTDLEDVAQEAFVAVSKALERDEFRGESRLETYVWRIAQFRAIDRLRRNRRRTFVDVDDLVLESEERSPIERVLSAERQRQLLEVLQEMPEGCRTLWGMIVEGLSYREMSARMGVSEGALRVRASRCRRMAVEARRRVESGE